MAAAYKSAGAVAGSAGTTSLAVSFPASVAVGDIAIIVATSFESDVTFPGTFTSQSTVSYGSGTYFRMGWKRCDGTEGSTSVNVTQSAGGVWSQIYLFSGAVGAGTPYEGYQAVTGFGSAASLTTPSITSTVADTLGALFAMDNGGAVTFTPASGYTERVDNSSAAGVANSFTVNTIIKASAGTTSAGTIASSSATFSGYVVFGLAFLPLVPILVDVTGSAASGLDGTVSSLVGVTPSGVATTGSPGAAVSSIAVTAEGTQGEGAVGTILVSTPTNLQVFVPSVAAVAATGDVAGELDISLTSDAGLGSAGDVAPGPSVDVAGNESTGDAGSPAMDVRKNLTGLSADGLPGQVGLSTEIDLTGVFGTAGVGNVDPFFGFIIPGASAVGTAGVLRDTVEIVVPGISRTAGIGSIIANPSKTLTGTSGTGQAGIIVPDVLMVDPKWLLSNQIIRTRVLGNSVQSI